MSFFQLKKLSTGELINFNISNVQLNNASINYSQGDIVIESSPSLFKYLTVGTSLNDIFDNVTSEEIYELVGSEASTIKAYPVGSTQVQLIFYVGNIIVNSQIKFYKSSYITSDVSAFKIYLYTINSFPYICNPVATTTNLSYRKVSGYQQYGLWTNQTPIINETYTDTRGLYHPNGSQYSSYMPKERQEALNNLSLVEYLRENFPDMGVEYNGELYFSGMDYWLNGQLKGFPGDTSGTGGGGGNFDDSSDTVGFGDLPLLSAVSSGFIKAYTPTVSQLNELASYLWTSDWTDVIKKFFNDPMDIIVGLGIVPLNIPSSANVSVKAGFVDTGITMPLVNQQFLVLDMGEIDIAEFYGSYLDYTPYTKLKIYLPYIGTRDISADEVMKNTISLRYYVDVLTGSCTAQIRVGGSVIYQFSGNCFTEIPITGRNFNQLIGNAINSVGAIGGAIATGGATTGNAIMNTAHAVVNSKPNIEYSGKMGATSGLLSIQQPYVFIEYPRQSLAENYNTFVGYPSNIKETLSNLSGYTEIEEIHIENIGATDSEVKEIENILKGGVII